MNYLTDKQMREAAPPFDFDNTMLGTYRLCDRRFYWFWRGVEQKIRPAYFAFGTAWQGALEAWYLSEGNQVERFEKAAAVAKQIFQNEAPMPDKTNNIDNLLSLLMWYTLSFPAEHWKIIPNAGHMELGFKFPLQGTPYFLTGAIDGYIQWEPHGFLTLENKTTGMAIGGQGSTYMKQWRLTGQVMQYFWALSQLLGKLPFGVLMNCASKRITLKEIDAFRKYETIPDGLFCRDLVPHSERDLIEFERSKAYEIQRIHRSWHEWCWPRTTEGRICAGGTGFGACPYFILCVSDLDPEEVENPGAFEGLTWRTESWEPWKRGRRGGE